MGTRGRLLLLSLAVLAPAANAAATPGEAVDLLLAGGTVVTMDKGFRVFEAGAVAVKGERIVAVGPAPELRARYTPARAIDTSGRIVMPGLVNTHSHVPMTLCAASPTTWSSWSGSRSTSGRPRPRTSRPSS